MPPNRWAHQDLNLGPAGYEPAALNLAELWARGKPLGGAGKHTSFAEVI
jgi:hypothetical protein